MRLAAAASGLGAVLFVKAGHGPRWRTTHRAGYVSCMTGGGDLCVDWPALKHHKADLSAACSLYRVEASDRPRTSSFAQIFGNSACHSW